MIELRVECTLLVGENGGSGRHQEQIYWVMEKEYSKEQKDKRDSHRSNLSSCVNTQTLKFVLKVYALKRKIVGDKK